MNKHFYKKASEKTGAFNLNILLFGGLGLAIIFILKPLISASNAASGTIKSVGDVLSNPIKQISGTTEAAGSYIKTISASGNAFDPNFYKKAPSGSKLLTVGDADNMAKQIYGVKLWFIASIDAGKVLAILKRCQTKSQISFLSERFSILYKEDMLAWFSGNPFNPLSGMTMNEIKMLTDYVSTLPDYK